MIEIAKLLTPEECDAIRDSISDDELWRDGGDTARGDARLAKNNLQADKAQAPVRGAISKISSTLLKNPLFKAYAQPANLVRIMINRFDSGMEYGDHVDAPYIDDMRTDLSFTVFLSDPSGYEGGELVIDTGGVQDQVKLPKGHMIVYAARHIHRVTKVTSGSRIACVGWVKSRIASPPMRETLFDLERVIADMETQKVPTALRTQLINIRNNILRDIGE